MEDTFDEQPKFLKVGEKKCTSKKFEQKIVCWEKVGEIEQKKK